MQKKMKFIFQIIPLQVLLSASIIFEKYIARVAEISVPRHPLD